jgi:hypothetical protein
MEKYNTNDFKRKREKMNVILKPTEGNYQQPILGEIIKEDKGFYYVRINSKKRLFNINNIWKFNKKDRLRVGEHKNDFPRYQITLEDL